MTWLTDGEIFLGKP